MNKSTKFFVDLSIFWKSDLSEISEKIPTGFNVLKTLSDNYQNTFQQRKLLIQMMKVIDESYATISFFTRKGV